MAKTKKSNISQIAIKAVMAIGGGVAGNRVSDALETVLPASMVEHAPAVTAIAGVAGAVFLPKFESIFLGMTAVAGAEVVEKLAFSKAKDTKVNYVPPVVVNGNNPNAAVVY